MVSQMANWWGITTVDCSAMMGSRTVKMKPKRAGRKRPAPIASRLLQRQIAYHPSLEPG